MNWIGIELKDSESNLNWNWIELKNPESNLNWNWIELKEMNWSKPWKLTKIQMFLLDICDENVGSMPYFGYPTRTTSEATQKNMGKEITWMY